VRHKTVVSGAAPISNEKLDGSTGGFWLRNTMQKLLDVTDTRNTGGRDHLPTVAILTREKGDLRMAQQLKRTHM
jgi:hypothetical protein